MLKPKKIKYFKQHLHSKKGKKIKNNLKFGDYGLQAKEPAWLTAKQIEATRKIITRYIKNNGKIWLRIFPHQPITKRVAETRMGSGKGNLNHWVANIKNQQILFEITSNSKILAITGLKLASQKLPCQTKLIYKKHENKKKNNESNINIK